MCPKKTMYFIKISRILRINFAGWIKNREGTTAIEFALMAIPYFLLTLGIIELSIMYAAATLLEGATTSASRLLRTGEIQMSGRDPEEMFRESLCSYATVLVDCDDVVVESIPLTSYADYETFAAQYDEDGDLVSQGFAVSGSDSAILVRVAYRYTMMVPFIGTLLAGPDSSRLFVSTIVLQTEPYDFGGET